MSAIVDRLANAAADGVEAALDSRIVNSTVVKYPIMLFIVLPIILFIALPIYLVSCKLNMFAKHGERLKAASRCIWDWNCDDVQDFGHRLEHRFLIVIGTIQIAVIIVFAFVRLIDYLIN